MTITMSSHKVADDDNLYETHTVSLTNVNPYISEAVKAQLRSVVETANALERQQWAIESNRASWVSLDDRVDAMVRHPSSQKKEADSD